MQILVHTDNHIDGNDELSRQVAAAVEHAANRFSERITRVEVHLTDENSNAKAGKVDKRCAMEARVAGRGPITVSHQDATVDQAIDGAADKLHTTLDKTFGRLSDHKGRTSFGGDQTS